MKRDIQFIEKIKNANHQEKEVYYEKLTEALRPYIFSYSFIKGIDAIAKEAFLEAVDTYQEDTPMLFSFYLARKVKSALVKKSKEYLEEKEIKELPTAFFQYLQMKLVPYHESEYLNLMQIRDVLGNSNLTMFDELLINVRKKTPEILLSVFPKYVSLTNEKKIASHNSVLVYEKKNQLSSDEEKILKLYLTDRETYPAAIAQKLGYSIEYVTDCIQKGMQKLEKYQDTRKNFFEEAPQCSDYYLKKRKELSPTQKHMRSKKTPPVEKIATPIIKEKKEQEQRQPKTKRSKKDKLEDIILYFKKQLTQDEHGFYPSRKDIAQEMGKTLYMARQYFERGKQLLDTDETFKERIRKEIEHFDFLLEDYLDNLKTDTLSHRQALIIQYYFYQDEYGKVRTRSEKEVIKMITQEGLHFDEVYIKKQVHSIIQRSYENIKIKQQVDAIREKMDTITLKKDEKRQEKILSTRFKTVLPFLKCQLRQDEHGYLPAKSDVSQQIGQNAASIINYIHYTNSLYENPTYHEKINQEIENFDALWKYFLESGDGFHPIRIAILEGSTYLREDGTLAYRTFEEIAQLISQNGLVFDAYFVQNELKKTLNYFYNDNNGMHEYLAKHPHLSLKNIRQHYFSGRTLKLNYLFEKQIQQDEHGFYPSVKDLAQITQTSRKNVYYLLRKNVQVLQDEKFQAEFFKKYPHLQQKCLDYLDSLAEDHLSKKQLQILESIYYLDENGTKRKRNYQEVAAMISHDDFHYDSFFITENIKKIFKLWKKYPDQKQQFLKTHPIYDRKDLMQLSKKKKEIIPQTLTEREITYLKAQLQQDEHGFFKTQTEVAKELKIPPITIYNILNTLRYLISENERKLLQDEIPHFNLLFNAYIDTLTAKDFSKQQRQIITSLSYIDENGIRKERTNQEIAEILSTDVLHFDEVYVRAQKRAILYLKRKYPPLKKVYYDLRKDFDEPFSKEDIADFRQKFEPENGKFLSDEVRLKDKVFRLKI